MIKFCYFIAFQCIMGYIKINKQVLLNYFYPKQSDMYNIYTRQKNLSRALQLI